MLSFFPKEADNKTQITLLGIGLISMVMAVLF